MYCGGEGTTPFMKDNRYLEEIFLLMRTENCVSPSNDFTLYIGYDNHLLTNTISTCARSKIEFL